MYTVKATSHFKKDLKSIHNRGYDIAKITEVIKQLAKGKNLPEKNKDHPLTGQWVGFRECHITPDWLLIYKIEDDILVLTLSRTGSHSNLF